MANSFKSSSSSRFVIEDSIPKVTSDGEPHEVMTIIAMLSGSIAAAIVLFILFSLIGNRRGSNNDIETSNSNTTNKDECTSPSTIIPMFTASHKNAADESDKSRPQLLSVSTISELLAETPNTGMLNYGYEECDLACESSKVVRFSGISTVKC